MRFPGFLGHTRHLDISCEGERVTTVYVSAWECTDTIIIQSFNSRRYIMPFEIAILFTIWLSGMAALWTMRKG